METFSPARDRRGAVARPHAPATTGAVRFAAKTENRLAAVNHRMRLFGAHVGSTTGYVHFSEFIMAASIDCLKLIVLFVVAPRTTGASMPLTTLKAPTHRSQWLPNELKQISQSGCQLQFTLYTGRQIVDVSRTKILTYCIFFARLVYIHSPLHLNSLTFC